MLPSSTHTTQQSEKHDVLFYLGWYGTPLGNLPTSPTQELSFEEVVVKALSLSRENPTVARVFPVFLAKNETSLRNFHPLKALVKKEHQENTLGFFLDLTSELTRNALYSHLAEQLERSEEVQDFFLPFNKKGKYGKRVMERNTPELAKKWAFTMNMSLESFQDVFHKYTP